MKDKEDIAKAVLDRMMEDEEREWMDNVYMQRLTMLGQRKGAGRKLINNNQYLTGTVSRQSFG